MTPRFRSLFKVISTLSFFMAIQATSHSASPPDSVDQPIVGDQELSFDDFSCMVTHGPSLQLQWLTLDPTGIADNSGFSGLSFSFPWDGNSNSIGTGEIDIQLTGSFPYTARVDAS